MKKTLFPVILLSLLLLVPACQNSPTAPSTHQNKVLSIAVTSPSGTTFFVGDTVTLTATAAMSDGRDQQITAGVWSSSDSSIATVNGNGNVAIVGIGKVDIVVTCGGKTGSLSIQGRTADSPLMGTWQATKAEGWRMVRTGGGFAEVPGSRRDLVVEGGTVTLVLEANRQAVGNAIPEGKYTITVIMPGTKQGVDSGFWFHGQGSKGPQIDFYPSSLGPDPEYGELPAFIVSLNGNSLALWDSGMTFLPFDFGWNRFETELNLAFIRK